VAAGRAATPELFPVGPGQPLDKSTDDAFRLDVFGGILFKGVQATLSTEIVISAFMLGHQIGLARIHIHPANRILCFDMRLRLHQLSSVSPAAEAPEVLEVSVVLALYFSYN
jgi:hypothetical protein